MSLPQKEFPDLPRLAEEYTGRYAACGLAFLPLCECRQRSLLLVYRPASLKNRLSAPEAAALLKGLGYDTCQSLDGLLAALGIGPLGASVGMHLHTLLCSLTLPVYVAALCRWKAESNIHGEETAPCRSEP